jgi:NDP-sugar pyrophosphorylase family protein
MDFAIIAAGEGSRLVQEGVTTPKPLINIQGSPLIERLIRIFLRNGAASVSVIVNEEMNEVQDFLKKLQLPVPLHLHIRSTPSSMHSFYELSRYLTGDRFCMTTVDSIFPEEEFEGYIQAFRDTDVLDGLMAVTDFVDDETPLYVKTDADQKIVGFGPSRPSHEWVVDNSYLPGYTTDHGCTYVSGGIYCLRQSAIRVLEKAISEGIARMRNYQRRLVAEGLYLKAYPFSKIIDVDHAEDIIKAEEFLLYNK